MEDSAAKSGKKKSDVVVAQARRLSIIDVSSEDDSLLGLPLGFLQDDASSESQEQRSIELFVSVDNAKVEELFEPVDDNNETNELVPQPSKSLEPEIVRQNGKYNLRKSLAWDSAFFTCEGVLDAEELSSMISVEKSQRTMLPGIQEEVHRSSDSISTLGSDTLTLETVETNLFEDVRASIQRSSRAVSMAGESSKVGSGLRQTKVGSGLKKVDLASQPKLRSKVAVKKPNISLQNPGKLAKPVSARPQFSQSVAAIGESTLALLKRPKVLDKPKSSANTNTKRTSLGGNLLKAEKDSTKVAAARGAPASKLPGSSRNVPRPPKSSSLASSTGTTGGATSSVDSSGSTASVKFSKPSSNCMKINTNPRMSNPNSGSNPKAPSQTKSVNKSGSGKSRLSAQYTPSTKLSSSLSPASSISDWSAESVSSISSLQQISSSSRDSFSRSSCNSVSIDFNAQSADHQAQTDDQSSAGSATRVSGLKASTKLAAPPPSSIPSGLRLPSPKIGFFDGVKSAARTPKRGNPSAPSNLPKAGTVSVSPRGSAIKSKLGKVNPERASTINAKPDAQRTSSNSKPKISPLVEASKAAKTEICSESRSAKSCPVTSPEGKTNTPLKFDSKVDEAGENGDDIGIHDKVTVFSQNNETGDALKAEVTQEDKCSAHQENAKLVLVSEEHTCVSDSSFETPTSSLEVVEVTKKGEDEFKTQLHSIENSKKKEKSCFEDQLDCLIREIGAMDIRSPERMVCNAALTSQQNITEDNVCVAEPSSDRELLVCIGEEDSLHTLSIPIISTSPTTKENTSCKRIPFSAKDSLCNIGGSFDASKGLIVPEGEKNSELSFPVENFQQRMVDIVLQ